VRRLDKHLTLLSSKLAAKQSLFRQLCDAFGSITLEKIYRAL